MSTEQKKWIDAASYEQLLRRWRFGVTGDSIFHGEIGTYYHRKLREKRAEVGAVEHMRLSNVIGWEDEGEGADG